MAATRNIQTNVVRYLESSWALSSSLGHLAAACDCLFVCLLVGWLAGWLVGWLVGWCWLVVVCVGNSSMYHFFNFDCSRNLGRTSDYVWSIECHCIQCCRLGRTDHRNHSDNNGGAGGASAAAADDDDDDYVRGDGDDDDTHLRTPACWVILACLWAWQLWALRGPKFAAGPWVGVELDRGGWREAPIASARDLSQSEMRRRVLIPLLDKFQFFSESLILTDSY